MRAFFMRCLGIIIVIMSVMVAPSFAFDIVGVGVDPSKAQTDALRLIAECFGKVRVQSATKVVDFQTVSDWVDIDASFSAANLDRFFVGLSKHGKVYEARYSFPASLVGRTGKVRRDYYRKVVFITFERVGYSVVDIDSFGEVSKRGFEFAVPPWVRRVVRRCIWRISDDFNGFEWVKEDG
jgi:hypothetical protein